MSAGTRVTRRSLLHEQPRDAQGAQLAANPACTISARLEGIDVGVAGAEPYGATRWRFDR